MGRLVFLIDMTRAKKEREPDLGRESAAEDSTDRAGVSGKRTAVRFVVVFVALVALFYLPYSFVSQTETYATIYLTIIAKATSVVLNIFGQGTTAVGPYVSSAALSFRIIPGCDGTEGFALFGAAVLASPFALRSRLKFLLIGFAVLFLVNTLRIVTLFIIGVYRPHIFHSVHMDVWPGFIIFTVLVTWLTWARWMLRKQAKQASGSE